MILAFKVGGQTYKVEFQSNVSGNNGIACVPKTTKDLEAMHMVKSQSPAMVVEKEIQKYIEKVLKLPIEIDRRYNGPGFGFAIDMYDMVKGL